MRRCALAITKQKLSEKELETDKQTECPALLNSADSKLVDQAF